MGSFLASASGINILNIPASALAVSKSIQSLANGNLPSAFPAGPWRPPEWAAGALTYLIDQNGNIYVPDAVFTLQHDLEMTLTQNPVLTGTNIVDHAYMQPQTVTLEIGMSDTMDSYSPGMWNTAGSKSVNAYRKFKSLALARTSFTLSTRLDIYQQMLISHISVPDDVTTLHALRATITFQQLILASVSTQPLAQNSSRPESTSLGNYGVTSGVSVPSGLLDGYGATGENYVPGGSLSSVYTGGLLY